MQYYRKRRRMNMLMFVSVFGLVAMVSGADPDDQYPMCGDPCAYHKNGSFHCANSHCKEFPEAVSTVQNIYMQHNEITRLPELDYPQLILLNLTENKLKDLTSVPFFETPTLQKLYLGSNELTRIDSDYFRGLESSLEILFLCMNKIASIEDDSFKGLKALETLDLSYNLIEVLNTNTLSDIQNLAWLHLAANQIKFIDSNSFLGLSNLRHIDLEENHIEKIAKYSFSECSKLEIVDVAQNYISVIEDNAFTYCPKLQVLHLEKNHLRELRAEMFHNMGGDGGKLESIYLDWNPLTSLPVRAFPQSVQRVSMTYLDQLEFIGDEVFDDIHFLKEVYLGHNHKLRRISDTAFGTEKKTPVQNIYLQNTSLTGLSENTFNWKRVTYANLHNTPWSCDCDLKWMVENDDIPTEVVETTICSFPDFLDGKALANVPADNFSCNPLYEYQRKLVRGILAAIIITALVLILGFGYKYRNRICARCTGSDIKYRTVFNNPNASSNGVDEGEVDINWSKGSLARQEV